MTEKTITIALTRYNEPDSLVRQTLESLASQQGVHADVLFLDQKHDESAKTTIAGLGTEAIRFNRIEIPAISISYARNRALETARTDLILYIDPDAIADPHWAAEMSKILRDSDAAIVGGKIVPLWHKKPLFLMKSNVVREQFSMLDLGDGIREVPKVIGASMGINRAKLPAGLRFSGDLGRNKGKLMSGEETAFCREARVAGGLVLYTSEAVVHHQVHPYRITYNWIIRRLFYAGKTRAAMGGMPEPSTSPGFVDWLTLPVTLPPYALGFAIQTFSDWSRKRSISTS